MMTRRTGILAMAVGTVGTLACAGLVARFLSAFRNNELGFKQGLTPPEFYAAMGQHYGNGFLAGFFLCLFLLLAGAGLEGFRGRKPRQP
jgi:hypothetical protein